MKKRLIHILCVISMVFIFILPRHRGGIFSNVIERDTTIYNVTYRDTIIYNVHKKDSVIIDYTLVPLHDSIIINDTVYIVLPLSAYHFADSLSDIWASGYRVTLDSVRYHFREVTKMVEREITIKPRRLTADVGGMLIKTADRWILSGDIRAAARINDRWSVEARAGVAAGESVMPFLGLGGRYSLR